MTDRGRGGKNIEEFDYPSLLGKIRTVTAGMSRICAPMGLLNQPPAGAGSAGCRVAGSFFRGVRDHALLGVHHT